MAQLTEQIVVNAPLDKTWNAVLGFDSRPKWSPRVKQSQIIGGSPLQVGSKIRLQVDRSRFTPVVAEIVLKERLNLLLGGPGSKGNHIYEFGEIQEGTAVSITGKYGGIVGVLVGWLMKDSFRKDVVEELQSIKSAAEYMKEG